MTHTANAAEDSLSFNAVIINTSQAIFQQSRTLLQAFLSICVWLNDKIVSLKKKKKAKK